MLVDKKVWVEKKKSNNKNKQKNKTNKQKKKRLVTKIAAAVANLVTCVWHSQHNQITDLTSSNSRITYNLSDNLSI